MQRISETNEITSWLSYFAKTVLEAQRATLSGVEFAIAKTKFFEHLGPQINGQQSKVIRKQFEAGPEGIAGGLSA